MSDERLARLLQLASPTLPVGAYSYSQGLEAAVEAGVVHDAGSAQSWIADVLELSVASMEAPVLLRLMRAWAQADIAAVEYWNALFLASRESAELRAETVQMGYSLTRLLNEINEENALSFAQLQIVDEPAFPTAYACAAAQWRIESSSALIAYLWSWIENQVMAAIKTVPLGQTAGQKILLALGARLEAIAQSAAARGDNELGNFAPGLAMLSSRHETQYSRLFRS
ncbi:MAG TPA: urease accessory protein UreF [Burkholderiales bacterium]|nr:urease accessory protein UreF [Burkholderiales bacterium]